MGFASFTAVANKKTQNSDTQALLLKEIAQLNKKTDRLNAKVARLEAEKNTGRVYPRTTPKQRQIKARNHVVDSPAIVGVNDNAQYKHVSFYQQPHLIVADEKDGINYSLYLDKNYYDISPDNLNQTTFMQIINQNSPLSTANNNLCIKNSLCFSALSNFDLRYYNRAGGVEALATGIIPSLVGVAVRPLFGPIDKNVVGSVNNANLFIDGYVNPYVSAHMNLAYVNGSVNVKTYSHDEPDWGSVYRGAAAVKMDEVFGTLIVPNTPLFVRIGKQYLNFGDYKPYPITQSLVQLLTQMRSGGVIAGAVLPSGLYVSANYSMARESLENISNPFAGADAVFAPYYHGNKDRNWGGKLGYQTTNGAFHLNTNISYIRDMRDSDYLQESAYFWTYGLAASEQFLARNFTTNQVFLMKRAPGLALHADAQWNQFGILAEYAGALQEMTWTNPNSKIHAWGLHGNVAFPVLGYETIADLGYERGYDANVFENFLVPGTFVPPEYRLPLGNALPKSRIVGTYSVAAMKGITVSAQWVHDKDFSKALLGTGHSSNMGTLRVSAQL